MGSGSCAAIRSRFSTCVMLSIGSFVKLAFGESIGRGETTSPPVGSGESERLGRACSSGDDRGLEAAAIASGKPGIACSAVGCIVACIGMAGWASEAATW